jgi:hypothetical protein
MRKLVALLFLVACGGHVGQGPCEGATQDPTCAQVCDPVTNPCPLGFYCADDGTCNAQCSQDGMGCSDGQYCDGNGMCQASIDADCPNVTLNGTKTTPTVELLLDQSGSMTSAFGNSDRWDAMKAALIDSMNGIVHNEQHAVIFGATLYTWNDSGTCPQLTAVPRAIDNLQAITDLLNSNQPVAETPTGESIDLVVQDFINNPPPADSPPIIILATDGEPDTCAQPNPQNGQAVAIAAAQNAYAHGIRLYILGVSSEVGAPHLQDMANAGVGNDPTITGSNAPYYTANDPAQLSAALQQIVGGVLSCELQLDGTVDPANADQGVVVLDGQTLQEGTDWILVDGTTIRLLGGACDDLLASQNPVVSATFPCGVVVN